MSSTNMDTSKPAELAPLPVISSGKYVPPRISDDKYQCSVPEMIEKPVGDPEKYGSNKAFSAEKDFSPESIEFVQWLDKRYSMPQSAEHSNLETFDYKYLEYLHKMNCDTKKAKFLLDQIVGTGKDLMYYEELFGYIDKTPTHGCFTELRDRVARPELGFHRISSYSAYNRISSLFQAERSKDEEMIASYKQNHPNKQGFKAIEDVDRMESGDFGQSSSSAVGAKALQTCQRAGDNEEEDEEEESNVEDNDLYFPEERRSSGRSTLVKAAERQENKLAWHRILKTARRLLEKPRHGALYSEGLEVLQEAYAQPLTLQQTFGGGGSSSATAGSGAAAREDQETLDNLRIALGDLVKRLTDSYYWCCEVHDLLVRVHFTACLSAGSGHGLSAVVDHRHVQELSVLSQLVDKMASGSTAGLTAASQTHRHHHHHYHFVCRDEERLLALSIKEVMDSLQVMKQLMVRLFAVSPSSAMAAYSPLLLDEVIGSKLGQQLVDMDQAGHGQGAVTAATRLPAMDLAERAGTSHWLLKKDPLLPSAFELEELLVKALLPSSSQQGRQPGAAGVQRLVEDSYLVSLSSHGYYEQPLASALQQLTSTSSSSSSNGNGSSSGNGSTLSHSKRQAVQMTLQGLEELLQVAGPVAALPSPYTAATGGRGGKKMSSSSRKKKQQQQSSRKKTTQYLEDEDEEEENGEENEEGDEDEVDEEEGVAVVVDEQHHNNGKPPNAAVVTAPTSNKVQLAEIEAFYQEVVCARTSAYLLTPAIVDFLYIPAILLNARRLEERLAFVLTSLRYSQQAANKAAGTAPNGSGGRLVTAATLQSSLTSAQRRYLAWSLVSKLWLLAARYPITLPSYPAFQEALAGIVKWRQRVFAMEGLVAQTSMTGTEAGGGGELDLAGGNSRRSQRAVGSKKGGQAGSMAGGNGGQQVRLNEVETLLKEGDRFPFFFPDELSILLRKKEQAQEWILKFKQIFNQPKLGGAGSAGGGAMQTGGLSGAVAAVSNRHAANAAATDSLATSNGNNSLPAAAMTGWGEEANDNRYRPTLQELRMMIDQGESFIPDPNDPNAAATNNSHRKRSSAQQATNITREMGKAERAVEEAEDWLDRWKSIMGSLMKSTVMTGGGEDDDDAEEEGWGGEQEAMEEEEEGGSPQRCRMGTRSRVVLIEDERSLQKKRREMIEETRAFLHEANDLPIIIEEAEILKLQLQALEWSLKVRPFLVHCGLLGSLADQQLQQQQQQVEGTVNGSGQGKENGSHKMKLLELISLKQEILRIRSAIKSFHLSMDQGNDGNGSNNNQASSLILLEETIFLSMVQEGEAYIKRLKTTVITPSGKDIKSNLDYQRLVSLLEEAETNLPGINLTGETSYSLVVKTVRNIQLWIIERFEMLSELGILGEEVSYERYQQLLADEKELAREEARVKREKDRAKKFKEKQDREKKRKLKEEARILAMAQAGEGEAAAETMMAEEEAAEEEVEVDIAEEEEVEEEQPKKDGEGEEAAVKKLYSIHSIDSLVHSVESLSSHHVDFPTKRLIVDYHRRLKVWIKTSRTLVKNQGEKFLAAVSTKAMMTSQSQVVMSMTRKQLLAPVEEEEAATARASSETAAATSAIAMEEEEEVDLTKLGRRQLLSLFKEAFAAYQQVEVTNELQNLRLVYDSLLTWEETVLGYLRDVYRTAMGQVYALFRDEVTKAVPLYPATLPTADHSKVLFPFLVGAKNSLDNTSSAAANDQVEVAIATGGGGGGGANDVLDALLAKLEELSLRKVTAAATGFDLDSSILDLVNLVAYLTQLLQVSRDRLQQMSWGDSKLDEGEAMLHRLAKVYSQLKAYHDGNNKGEEEEESDAAAHLQRLVETLREEAPADIQACWTYMQKKAERAAVAAAAAGPTTSALATVGMKRAREDVNDDGKDGDEDGDGGQEQQLTAADRKEEEEGEAEEGNEEDDNEGEEEVEGDQPMEEEVEEEGGEAELEDVTKMSVASSSTAKPSSGRPPSKPSSSTKVGLKSTRAMSGISKRKQDSSVEYYGPAATAATVGSKAGAAAVGKAIAAVRGAVGRAVGTAGGAAGRTAGRGGVGRGGGRWGGRGAGRGRGGGGGGGGAATTATVTQQQMTTPAANKRAKISHTSSKDAKAVVSATADTTSEEAAAMVTTEDGGAALISQPGPGYRGGKYGREEYYYSLLASLVAPPSSAPTNAVLPSDQLAMVFSPDLTALFRLFLTLQLAYQQRLVEVYDWKGQVYSILQEHDRLLKATNTATALATAASAATSAAAVVTTPSNNNSHRVKLIREQLLHMLAYAGHRHLACQEQVALLDRMKLSEDWLIQARGIMVLGDTAAYLTIEHLKDFIKTGEKLLFAFGEEQTSLLQGLKDELKRAKHWKQRLDGILSSMRAGATAGGTAASAASLAHTNTAGQSEALAALLAEVHHSPAPIRVDLSAEMETAHQDSKSYCLCRLFYFGEMIGCDHCEEWYHYSCVNMNAAQAARYEDYTCIRCALKNSISLSVIYIRGICERWLATASLLLANPKTAAATSGGAAAASGPGSAVMAATMNPVANALLHERERERDIAISRIQRRILKLSGDIDRVREHQQQLLATQQQQLLVEQHLAMGMSIDAASVAAAAAMAAGLGGAGVGGGGPTGNSSSNGHPGLPVLPLPTASIAEMTAEIERLGVEQQQVLQVRWVENNKRAEIVSWMREVLTYLNPPKPGTAFSSSSDNSQLLEKIQLARPLAPSDFLQQADLQQQLAATLPVIANSTTSSLASNGNSPSLTYGQSMAIIQHCILPNLLPSAGRQLLTAARQQGIEVVADIPLILDTFRYLSWCQTVLSVLRYPPTTTMLKKLLEKVKDMKVVDEKIVKALQSIHQRACAWKSKVRKLLYSKGAVIAAAAAAASAGGRLSKAATGSQGIDEHKLRALVIEGNNLPFTSRLKMALQAALKSMEQPPVTGATAASGPMMAVAPSGAMVAMSILQSMRVISQQGFNDQGGDSSGEDDYEEKLLANGIASQRPVKAYPYPTDCDTKLAAMPAVTWPIPLSSAVRK